MLSGEDLRGREFQWNLLSESDREIVLLEDGIEALRLVPAIESSRAYLANVGQERLRIEHSVGAVGPTFRVTDLVRGTLVATSYYGPDINLTALFDIPRAYTLRRTTNSSAWQDEVGDVVAFRPNGVSYVLMGADPADALALLLLGIVMAAEHTLFAATVAR